LSLRLQRSSRGSFIQRLFPFGLIGFRGGEE
jgi:hypothetical protein